MSEQRELLQDSARKLFAAHPRATTPAVPDRWPGELWADMVSIGLPLLLVPEESGGPGTDVDDACGVLQVAGEWQVALPVAESMLATRLAMLADVDLSQSACSLAVRSIGRLEKTRAGYRYTGTLPGVPWGGDVSSIVTTVTHEGARQVVVVSPAAASLTRRHNLAGEPRDDLVFNAATVLAATATDSVSPQLLEFAALARAAQIAGALTSALQQTVAYARERRQFGKTIGQFQAVQQLLATFGAEAAAATCAVRAAGVAASRGPATFQMAAAKLRANRAVAVASPIAHQVHGAIGFTWEHSLRQATQRLLAWRSDYGNDRFWSERLGATILHRGAGAFWSDLTDRDDAAAIRQSKE